ncbi:hypothetical protein KS26_15125 [Salmonella enterica]|nr:hypothetical protein [Salmonella enterica]
MTNPVPSEAPREIKRSFVVKSHYIVYYEGMDKNGNIVMNGNIAADAENLTDAGDFYNYLCEYALSEANKSYQSISRIVLKGVFKL